MASHGRIFLTNLTLTLGVLRFHILCSKELRELREKINQLTNKLTKKLLFKKYFPLMSTY